MNASRIDRLREQITAALQPTTLEIEDVLKRFNDDFRMKIWNLISGNNKCFMPFLVTTSRTAVLLEQRRDNLTWRDSKLCKKPVV